MVRNPQDFVYWGVRTGRIPMLYSRLGADRRSAPSGEAMARFLKLERMEIHGFKSFYGRTRFDFPEGITAVVGPNGCGKSNFGDAISWVLGEQRASSLRRLAACPLFRKDRKM